MTTDCEVPTSSDVLDDGLRHLDSLERDRHWLRGPSESSNLAAVAATLRVSSFTEEHHAWRSPNNDRRIDCIELNVADVERSKAFYGNAFGWTFKDYGPTYCEFADGRLTGGFTTNSQPTPGGPLVILYADDLVDTQRRVESAGGRIAKAVFDFPGGQRFHFLDPDGYELAVWTKR